MRDAAAAFYHRISFRRDGAAYTRLFYGGLFSATVHCFPDLLLTRTLRRCWPFAVTCTNDTTTTAWTRGRHLAWIEQAETLIQPLLPHGSISPTPSPHTIPTCHIHGAASTAARATHAHPRGRLLQPVVDHPNACGLFATVARAWRALFPIPAGAVWDANTTPPPAPYPL